MPASYPTSAKTFATITNSDTSDATQINEPREEITAIEQDLIAGLPIARGGTGNTTAGTAGQVLTSTGTSSAAFQNAVSPKTLVQGRLTLTTAVPVTTADVTAAGTLYYTPYNGNQIGLYTGSAWVALPLTELSISVPAVGNQVYDAFVDYNAGTPALTLTAWSSDTARATALTTQDGVLVLTGTLGKRYVGTVRTVTASQLNDSFALRHVWNYYHRVSRPMRVLEAANSWTYDSATYQQANASAANQLDFVCGVSEDALFAQVSHHALVSAAGGSVSTSIGLDGITPTTGVIGMRSTVGATAPFAIACALHLIPAVGRHTLTWIESGGGATTTWYGDNNTPTLLQSGIHGMWKA